MKSVTKNLYFTNYRSSMKNPWNYFVKQHAGMGLSMSELGNLYQMQKGGIDYDDDYIEPENLVEYLDVHQILLHPQVARTVGRYNEDFNSTNFKKDTSGFMAPLNRMENIISLSPEQLPPIQVKYVGFEDFNGEIKAVFEIMDGRHRFARALIEGLEKVPVVHVQ